MQQLDLSIGLVRQLADSGTRWLALWNAAANQLEFVSTERLEGESSRDAVIREVAWVLYLERREIIVASMVQADMDFVDCLPGMADESQVRAAFYNVEIYRKSALDKIAELAEAVWLDSEEIWAGVARDGRRLDPRLVYLIHRSQVIQHWESSSGTA